MPCTVFLVVDTNLFHECIALDAPDFPWADLGDFDEIVLLVSGPVTTELDGHKKDSRARIKKRAIKAGSWFRGMLLSETGEHIFREQGPRVVMRITAQTASQDHPQVLDMTEDDDIIVGVAAALSKSCPDDDIRVLSDDARPISKAKAIGLKFSFLPPSWLRPPETDEQQREIHRLKAQLEEMARDHPSIEIMARGAVGGRVTLTREAFAPFRPVEVALLHTKLQEQYSLAAIEDALGRDAVYRRMPNDGSRYHTIFVEPNADALDIYRNQVYPDWINRCVEHICELRTSINNNMPSMVVEIILENTGYRPAEDVRIKFWSSGNFLIAPPKRFDMNAKLLDLPPLRDPPTGQWMRDGQPLPYINGRRRLDTVTLAAPLPPLQSLSQKDEDWYFDPEAPEEPTTAYAMVCRRLRHQGGVHTFRLRIYPQTNDTVVSGALQIEVSASNIGRAVTATIPIRVDSTFSSPMPSIESYLRRQKPIGTLP